MVIIGQLFRTLLARVSACRRRESVALPPDIAAERLQLLLSCGF
jgi:hypothetical protein